MPIYFGERDMSIEEIKIYECELPGHITETTADKQLYIEYPIATSQFCIVKRFEVMREEILPFLKKDISMPYAIVEVNKKKKVYHGIDRNVGIHTPDEMCNFSREEAQIYFDLLENRNELELLFVRVAGQKNTIPLGYVLYGYDVTYPVGEYSDGFSVIGDCLFWARYHGCDEEGTLFQKEFESLNEHGLFDSAEAAHDYMVKYLNQDFAETGEYCIYEVYGK